MVNVNGIAVPTCRELAKTLESYGDKPLSPVTECIASSASEKGKMASRLQQNIARQRRAVNND